MKLKLLTLTLPLIVGLLRGTSVFAQSSGFDSSKCPPGQLCNPLKSQSIGEFLNKILDVLLVFALPIIVFFIMYAGFLFVTARGDTGQIEKARTALLWSVVGGVIVLGAKVISAVIQGTVTAL